MLRIQLHDVLDLVLQVLQLFNLLLGFCILLGEELNSMLFTKLLVVALQEKLVFLEIHFCPFVLKGVDHHVQVNVECGIFLLVVG
jgi:hypothetical protein